MRTEKLPSEIFICPYNDVFVYTKDPNDIQSRSNFTDFRANLAYSFADPYPDTAAVQAGHKWTSHLERRVRRRLRQEPRRRSSDR